MTATELTHDALPALIGPATGHLIGYARVSTSDQNLGRQIDALNAAGVLRIFTDKLSGKNADRPGLIEAFDHLRPGDTLVVLELSRLGRSLKDLIALIEALRVKGVHFRSLKEAIDTSTITGRFMLHLFAALAEFVRELIVQGTHEGHEAARERGVRIGRPPAMTPDQVDVARHLLATMPNATVAGVARYMGISRPTLIKYLTPRADVKVIEG